MSITEIIKPIKLLKGAHKDTAKTGQGCFMNVIAYLNGEPQITDQSPCVCITVRSLAVQLNDRLQDDQRQRMIPYIERAMGSADCSKEEFKRRLDLLVTFADKQAALAARAFRVAYTADIAYATDIAYTADIAYAARAVDAARAARAADAARAYAARIQDVINNALSAARSATLSADSAYTAAGTAALIEEIEVEMTEAYFTFLDAALPPAQPKVPQTVIERAEKLVELATAG